MPQPFASSPADGQTFVLEDTVIKSAIETPSSTAGPVHWARVFSSLLAFSMAIVALLNSMPAVGGLPQIGPLPAEYLRSGMFLGSVAVVLCSMGFGLWARDENPKLLWPGVLADFVLFAASVWVAYEFAVVNIDIQESLFFFDPYHGWVTMMAIAIMIILCWRVWGLPLAVFGIITVLYYFTGQWWPGLLNMLPRSFVDSLPEDMLFNLGNGMFGFIFETVIYTVFPFIVFGALLEGTGIGESLIRLAFRLTRRSRGGPAHAAILASSLFGTMSGVPVANVVGTGVMTIPMIKRRGFSPEFAGGIEATASTGGQIVPPIMGAAALIMADQLRISYLVVITAALLPALFYYLSLFFSVTFESRRLNIRATDPNEIEKLTATDIINLFILLGAVAVLVSTLLYGLSAAAAGVFGVAYMLVASFLSKPVRQKPSRILIGIAKGGEQFARLAVAIGVVGVVLGVLSGTGLPVKLAIVVDAAMGQSLLLGLIVTGITALIFGMGMPTLPAYLTIILILGPTLLKLGLSLLVAHMFVFYFGVASAITPPVAIAAYAGAAIAGAKPMQTGVMAFRLGLAMFIVPFAFAYYPELLLVDEVGGFTWGGLTSICIRLILALWLLTSAFSRYDTMRIALPEILLRLALAGTLLVVDPFIHWAAFAAGVTLILLNRSRAHKMAAV